MEIVGRYLPVQRSNASLLTTVDNLPDSMKLHYPRLVAVKRMAVESPLDLTIRNLPGQITPPSTPSPPKKRYRLFEQNENESVNILPTIKIEKPAIQIEKPKIESDKTVIKSDNIDIKTESSKNLEKTPTKPIPKVNQRSNKQQRSSPKKQSRNKVTKKLKFDELTSSPVSGTIIRRLDQIEDDDQIGDIDPEYNIVEVTDEAKAEIDAIPNVIGAYICKLCEKEFIDAFELARHRCRCIVLLEYRCPECGKRFNCPANLASHRRWHKPKDQQSTKKSSDREKEDKFSCSMCDKKFKRLAYLKKHQLVHKNSSAEDSSPHQSDENSQPLTPNYYEESNSEVHNHNNNKLQTFTQIVFRYADRFQDHLYSSPENSVCSINSPDSHRMEDNAFTEDENLAAHALAHLRNGSTVIRHTTTA